jgi:hypothetical protein
VGHELINWGYTVGIIVRDLTAQKLLGVKAFSTQGFKTYQAKLLNSNLRNSLSLPVSAQQLIRTIQQFESAATDLNSIVSLMSKNNK